MFDLNFIPEHLKSMFYCFVLMGSWGVLGPVSAAFRQEAGYTLDKLTQMSR